MLSSRGSRLSIKVSSLMHSRVSNCSLSIFASNSRLRFSLDSLEIMWKRSCIISACSAVNSGCCMSSSSFAWNMAMGVCSSCEAFSVNSF